MVGSGVSGHYFDDAFISRLLYKLASYQVLDAPRIPTTAGRHPLNGVARGLHRGNVVDSDRAQRLVQLPFLVVPGLEHIFFQAAQSGVVSIYDIGSPRLEEKNFNIPLQELASDLYSFSLNVANIADGSSTLRLVMQAVADANLWCLVPTCGIGGLNTSAAKAWTS